MTADLSADALATIVRLISDAVVCVDGQYRVVFVNDAALSMFGWPREELVGQPLDVLLPRAARGAHSAHVDAFGKESGAARLMGERRLIRGCRRDGSTFPAEASIVKSGTPEARIYTAILRDVTERVRTEANNRILAEAGALLAGSLDYDDTFGRVADLAVRGLADVVVVYAYEETGELRRVAVRHADPDQADLAKALAQLPVEGSRAQLRAVLEEARPVLASRVGPEDVERYAGGEAARAGVVHALAPVSWMAVPLVARERALGALVFVSSRPDRPYDARDLDVATELGRRAGVAVDNARLYRAAVRATAMRDEVLSMVAHDLRNPLGGIGMAASIIHQRVAAMSDPRAGAIVKASEGIRAATERMERLIGDLVEVSRAESGQLQLERVATPPERLVTEAIGALAVEAERREIVLHARIDEDAPPVDADPRRVVQVLVNLVGNAVKFVSDGGRVEVRARGAGHVVEFVVADDGPGVPAAHVAHLFDRFWQGKATDRRGVGLGLSIARGIVEAHGGRIWLDTAVERGATFRFTVPAKR